MTQLVRWGHPSLLPAWSFHKLALKSRLQVSFLGGGAASGDLWDLSSPPGLEPRPLAVEAESLSRLTAGGSLKQPLLLGKKYTSFLCLGICSHSKLEGNFQPFPKIKAAIFSLSLSKESHNCFFHSEFQF